MARVAHPQHAQSPSEVDFVKIASGLSALLGLYMLLSAWIRDLDVGNLLNGIIAGAAALLFGVARYSRAGGRWASWGIALVGAWFLLTPWIYRDASWGWSLNALVVGFVLLVLGTSSARAPASDDHPDR
jgi:hypothetical protein